MQTQEFQIDYNVFEPFDRLIDIELRGNTVQVPENNSLLRGLQFLYNEGISYGDFCWNGDCGHCAVRYTDADNQIETNALACRINATEGMKINLLSKYIEPCMR